MNRDETYKKQQERIDLLKAKAVVIGAVVLILIATTFATFNHFVNSN